MHVAFRPLSLSIGKLWRGNGVKLYFANRLRMPRNSPIRIWMRENALWKASFDILSDAAGGVCRLETERHRGRHPLQRSPPLTFVLSKAGNLPCFSLYRTHVDYYIQVKYHHRQYCQQDDYKVKNINFPVSIHNRQVQVLLYRKKLSL